MKAALRVGKGVVPLVSAFGVARLLTVHDTVEEVLEGPVHAMHHVLQSLRVDALQLRVCLAPAGQRGLLLEPRRRAPQAVVIVGAPVKQGVVEVATGVQGVRKNAGLCFGRVKPIAERLVDHIRHP